MSKLLIYAEWLVSTARDSGHIDARIMKIEKKYIIIHAGTQDEWKPCGNNETITTSDMRNCYNPKTKIGWWNERYEGLPPWA